MAHKWPVNQLRPSELLWQSFAEHADTTKTNLFTFRQTILYSLSTPQKVSPAIEIAYRRQID